MHRATLVESLELWLYHEKDLMCHVSVPYQKPLLLFWCLAFWAFSTHACAFRLLI